MLMPVREETLKKYREIERLEYIKDVIIPEARADNRTNLNLVTHSCGTPSCLMGRAIAHGIAKPNGHIDGLTRDEYWSIFDTVPAAGTLDDRSKAIDTIIQRKLGEM